MKKQGLFLLLSLTLILMLINPSDAQTDPATRKPKAVVLVIDTLMIDDLTAKATPNLFKILQQSSSGLMNTHTAADRAPANTHLTMANGRPMKGGKWAGAFYNVSDHVYNQPGVTSSDETADRLYTSLTGYSVIGNSVVNPWIEDIVKQNSDRNQASQVATLGEALAAAGISTTIVGNSDTATPRRYAGVFIMNSRGQVKNGIIGSSTLQQDRHIPSGVKTNYQTLLALVPNLIRTEDLVILELGDLSRLAEYRPVMSKTSYLENKAYALRSLDQFVGQLMSPVERNNAYLLVLSPTPFTEEARTNMVTPVIISGGEFTGPGLLTSTTTRQRGLIANTDIAPTILSLFHISNERVEMEGRPVTAVKTKNTLDYLKSFNENMVLIYAQRPPIVTATVAVEVIILAGAVLAIWFGRNRHLITWIQRIVLGFLSMAPVLLFYKFLRSSSTVLSGVTVFTAAIIVTVLLDRLRLGFKKYVALLSLFTSLAIVVDLLTGGSLMVSSPFGYDLMVGARYYGIGNEYSGILLGSTLLGAACLTDLIEDSNHQIFIKLLLAIYLVVVSVVIYAPNLGAEAGSFIAAIVAFTYYWIVANGGKMTVKRVGLLAAGTLLFLFAGALLDHLIYGTAQSHIGKAMGQLMNGQWQIIWDIITRKIQMNLRIIRYTVWTLVLMAIIAVLAFFIFRPRGVFKKVAVRYPNIFLGIKAIIVASLAGFAFNDSGIVEAATASIYVIFPFLYLVLEVKKQ